MKGESCGVMHTIFLIRHGESETNAGFSTAGPESVKLTMQGIDQAKHIAAYLKSQTSLDLIVTSRYLRTKETAAFTESLFPSVPLEQWEVHEFTYLSSMHHELSTTEGRRPLVEAYWEQCLPSFVDGPGSESFESFIKRGRAFLAELKDPAHGDVAIFSHQQFITALLWLIERNPTEITQPAMRDFKNYLDQNPLSNGAIVHMQFRHKQRAWHFKRVTEHLEQPVSVQREWAWAQERRIPLPVGG